MPYNFDHLLDRRSSDSLKWNLYDAEVLPLWVADMDFVSPEPVLRALHARIDHGVFGYGKTPAELREVIVERLARLYGWRVTPEDLVFLPGVVPGFNLAARALTTPGDGLLIQTPVYPPFLEVPTHTGLTLNSMELTRRADGYYEIDFDVFAACAARSRLFLLCNPHNPVGRAFHEDELRRMAELCLRHGVTLCSDEIHCDLLFSGTRHIPIAALDPEIAAQTITLMAPSKTYNIAGLECSFAVIQNPDLRRRFEAARQGMVPGCNLLGYVAALAAYRDGQEWLDEVLRYLEANRDFLQQFVAAELPGITMSPLEATYLAWLDCRALELPGKPCDFFRERARVGLNDGATFGPGGEGFVRLNFGCPRATLTEALMRMKAALAAREI